jgi:uncharacterized protein (TIGR02687 family)
VDLLHKSLARQFARHRIVFWYDPAGDWTSQVETLALDSVEVIKVANNEFGVKLRVLRDEPKQSFLLYFDTARPRDEENWLLDVLLSHAEFHADLDSMNREQAGLPPEFQDLAKEHSAFFANTKCREALARTLEPDDSHRRLRRRMIAIALGAKDDSLDAILLVFCQRYARENMLDHIEDALGRYALIQAFWSDVEKQYGYVSEDPGFHDFLLDLFRFTSPVEEREKVTLAGQAVLFMARWKDSATSRESFQTISERCAGDLNIVPLMRNHPDIPALMEGKIDGYEIIEQEIIQWLRDQILRGDLRSEKFDAYLHLRRDSFWYDKYASIYQALKQAVRLLDRCGKLSFEVDSASEAVEQYTQEWSKVDYFYRKFHEHRRASNQPGILAEVEKAVEDAYITDYQVPLAKRWEGLLDVESAWPPKELNAQSQFFERVVKPRLQGNKKLFVIISDALRYECGVELQSRLQRVKGYTADLDYQIATLPSFTQLGMAALLPHDTLSLTGNGKTALVDGQSTQGLPARLKVLEKNSGVKARVFKAEDFLKLHTKDEGRPMTKAQDLIYIYHNEIDEAGDKIPTEESVTTVASRALDNLIKIVRKVASSNGSNMVITADHGFLFQHRQVDEIDCPVLPEVGPGGSYEAIARRYVVGRNLPENPTLRIFPAQAAGLEGDLEIGVVKGIQRLPVKGSGKRFVHGGAMPQEVIVPVLSVNYSSGSKLRRVEVEVLSCPPRITTSQVAIRLYQTVPISESEKLLSRELRVGLYSPAGDALSDEQWIDFESLEDEARLRERVVNLTLGHKADDWNEKEIFFRLFERIERSNKLRMYGERPTTLGRHLGNDFDEF